MVDHIWYDMIVLRARLPVLTTSEFGNLVTDIMLLVFPFPLLFAVKIHWQK